MISIVTPTFNRAALLEATMRSVLDQEGADVEYIVIDGHSTDETATILEKHSDRLAYWVSEPDTGQYHAINKGFANSHGEIMAWIGSDDKYCPWAFSVVEDIFRMFKDIQWITSLYPLTWDIAGRAVACQSQRGYSYRSFLRGENLPGAGWPAPGGWIQQESTFWRRSLWERAGGYLDESITLAADFELWARFFRLAPLHGVATPLAGFRAHGDQRSVQSFAHYVTEATAVLEAHAGRLPNRAEAHLRERLRRYVPQRVRRVRWMARIDDPRPGIFYDQAAAQWTTRPI